LHICRPAATGQQPKHESQETSSATTFQCDAEQLSG